MKASGKKKIDNLHEHLANHLDTIRGLFTCPVKVTLVCRTPELADGGVVIGNDDLDAAIGEIERLKDRDKYGGKAKP